MQSQQNDVKRGHMSVDKCFLLPSKKEMFTSEVTNSKHSHVGSTTTDWHDPMCQNSVVNTFQANTQYTSGKSTHNGKCLRFYFHKAEREFFSGHRTKKGAFIVRSFF